MFLYILKVNSFWAGSYPEAAFSSMECEAKISANCSKVKHRVEKACLKSDHICVLDKI